MRAPAGNTRSRSRSTLAVLMTMRPPSLRRSMTLMSYVLRTRSGMSRSSTMKQKARSRVRSGLCGGGLPGRTPRRNLRRGYGVVSILNPFSRIGNWPNHAIAFDHLCSRAMILCQPPDVGVLLARQEVEPGHAVLADHRTHQDDHGAPDFVPKLFVRDVRREFGHYCLITISGTMI